MNKKKLIYFFMITLLCCIFQVSLTAQNKVKGWKIKYETDFSTFDSIQLKMMKSIGLSEKDEPAITAYTSANFIRVQNKEIDYNIIQISNIKGNTSYKYLLGDRVPSSMKNTAYKVPLAFPKIVVIDDESYTLSSHSEMILSEMTQTIEGIICHLAIFKVGNSELRVWYVKGLPQIFWEDYNYLLKVPGLPLRIETPLSGNEKGSYISIVAKSIVEIELSTSFFEIPKGYFIKEITDDNN